MGLKAQKKFAELHEAYEMRPQRERALRSGGPIVLPGGGRRHAAGR